MHLQRCNSEVNSIGASAGLDYSLCRKFMSINDEILAFAKKRSDWQRDLLRRIATQPDIQDLDIATSCQMLKATIGLDTPVETKPLEETHLSNKSSTGGVPTTLIAVDDVKNANQLTPGQTLPFGKGITLIFGLNGSGKTGYSRILKQVCRVRRDEVEPILGNVFATNSPGPAQATISYKVGDELKVINWKDGDKTPAELSRISVFDSSTAPLYADKQNKIEFLPFGLDIIPRFAKALEAIGKKIDNEVAILKTTVTSQLPNFPGLKYRAVPERLSIQTPAAQLLDATEIEDLGRWEVNDDDELKRIELELSLASAPAGRISQLNRLRNSLESVDITLSTLEEALRDDSYVTVLETEALANQQARVAASEAFASDPLGELIGTPLWREFMAAASRFSLDVYPHDEFPVNGEGKLCVLCQQTLSADASERFNRFREFLKNDSQQKLELSRKAISNEKIRISSLKLPDLGSLKLQLAELIDFDAVVGEDFFNKLTEELEHLAKRSSQIMECLDHALPSDDVVPNRPIDFSRSKLLKSKLDAEDEKLKKLTSDSAALKKIQEAHQDLLDRKKFSENKELFLKRRDSLRRIARLQQCRENCDTTVASRTASELRKRYLTEAFKEAINDEIKKSGLGYLPIMINEKSEKGDSFIGVALNKTGKAATSKILSEGEFRGLALACFFAETRNIDDHHGIVVDDPVSSLDHMHMQQVVRRLIEEAQKRPQVIVFTHDLSFYWEVWNKAAEANISVSKNWIYKAGVAGCGFVAVDESPWQAKNVTQRYGQLDALAAAIPDPPAGNPDAHMAAVEQFYTKLRETWERLVEEYLLNGVVTRFQPGVMTQSLKGAYVSDDDYAKVYFEMKKSSEYSGHDRSPGRAPALRTRLEAKADLEELKNYTQILKKRRDQLQTERKKLEEPEPPKDHQAQCKA
jgi:hypothetical protein